MISAVGVARSAVGSPAPPGRIKKLRRNLQKKIVSASPAHQVHLRAEQESILGHFAVRGRFGTSVSSLDRHF